MSTPKPPAWPLRILRWVLRPSYLEEIEGDMEEWFHDLLETHSLSATRRLYAWNVVRLLRPSLIRLPDVLSTLYRPIMLKNHVAVALRVFRRERIYTFVNLLSMSLSLAISLLILLYVKYETSYEQDNPTADRTVRITVDYLNGNTVIDQDCETYPPLGPLIHERFPEVEAFARAYNIDGLTVKVGDNVFSQNAGVYAVDSTFFEMFNYPMLHGTTDGLFQGPFEAVITESEAMRYFGRTDVVGEQIASANSDNLFMIRGVIKDSPPNTHLKVKFLFSYVTMISAFGERDDNWGGNNTFTYFRLNAPESYPTFEEKLVALNAELKANNSLPNERVIAQPIADIHLYSQKSFEPETNGDATSVYFLFGVALLVILIAMVNYINLSTSKALDRAKEVGVRKVLGSTQSQLRSQFFVEAFLINVISGVLAAILVLAVWGQFKRLADLPLDLSLGQTPEIWLLLLAGILISTFLSGIFPAYILASFKPVSVLKGKLGTSKRGGWLRKGLVVTQFAITLFLLVQTLAANQQLRFLRDIDLGVDISQTLVVQVPGGEGMEQRLKTFKGKILGQPTFSDFTVSTCVPGLPSHAMGTTTGINLTDALEELNFNFYIYRQDAAFVDAMRMKMVAGENFLPGGDHKLDVLVNEEAIRLWGLPSAEEAVGKTIDMWGDNRRIRGVIQNFHQTSAKSDFIPMIFAYSEMGGDYASIRLQPGRTANQLAKVRNLYQETFPNSPFDYFFMDQEYDKVYRADEQFSQVFTVMTGFAILIACIGLFGLVSFSVIKRSREIGIRKVLGANILQIINLLGREFVSLVLLASLIGLPLTYFLINRWLERYAFHIDLNVGLFLGPIVIMLVVATITVLSQTLQIATTNPVSAMREE